MGVSMEISDHRKGVWPGVPGWDLARLLRLCLVVLLAASVAAVPAEAKKRKHARRSHYSPPQAAMVIDAYSGKLLYSQNPDEPRYPASVTKVMTLYLLFEQLHNGHLEIDSKLKVTDHAASRPPSKLGLEAGGSITVRDAMYALVTKSANDVASVVAENIAGSETAFARMMTQKARAIGMSKTTFRNASGLPDRDQTTTARDLVTLGRRVLKDFPEESKIFRTRYFQYGNQRFKNHNRLLFSYAGMEGMKTGFTRDSGFNLLASCRRDDKHLIAVVLGGRSSSQRNARMQTLLNQSWRKAVALNELKQRGLEEPVAIAGILQADMMPERNPAFHESVSERTLRVAMAASRKNEAPEAGEKPLPRLAVAAPADVADTADDAAEESSAEQGDTDAEVTPSDTATGGPYHIQVGSFLDAKQAHDRLTHVSAEASNVVDGHDEMTVSGEVRGKSYYRARFGKFSRGDAASACKKLKRMSIECMVVRIE